MAVEFSLTTKVKMAWAPKKKRALKVDSFMDLCRCDERLPPRQLFVFNPAFRRASEMPNFLHERDGVTSLGQLEKGRNI